MPSQGGNGGNGMFLFSSRTAILGNLFDNNLVGEHNFRSMYWNGLVVSSNTFQNPNSAKANLTLRGPPFSVASGGNLPAGTWSQYGVVADNKFVGAAGVQVPVNTSIDAVADARTRYIIFERNWWTNQIVTVAALGLDSSFSAIRNNIIDMSANTNAGGFQALTVTNNGDAYTATDNVIYNNTIYANQVVVPTSVIGIRLFNGSVNTIIKNNLLYAPTATTVTVVFSAGAPGVTGTVGDVDGTFGNSSNLQGKSVNPSFASGAPAVPADFKITGGYALGTGVLVPVWSDYFGVANVAPWDGGAVRH
jgi:hypothetical protein